MEELFRHLKKNIPAAVFRLLQPFYHWLLARLAAAYYCYPSRKLIVIGVTGTSGKSSTSEILCQLLEQAGYRVGLTSTIKFKVADAERLNDQKMTMVGRFRLQKLLRQMLRAGCDYAIIETTSEGIRQYRHLGVYYDILVFTNLYPEHIDSHGSFENYKQTKLELFKHLEKLPDKTLRQARGDKKKIEKVIIANIDDEQAPDFLSFKVDKKYGFGIAECRMQMADVNKIRAEKVELFNTGAKFEINNSKFEIKLLGDHNVYNSLAAVTVGLSQEISLEKLKDAIASVKNIEGRLEFIEADQDFKVIVDYAFEPRAMEKLYAVVRQIKHKKIIHVLGTTGGGRDKDRGFKLGQLAGQQADVVIATNEDPYEDDPAELVARVAAGAEQAGKINNVNLSNILDRRLAIKKALSLAEPGDIVLITGKGSEQGMMTKVGLIPWDDRQVVLEEIHRWG